MKVLLLAVTLISCAESREDLSGKMFTFPQQSSNNHVRLTASGQNFSALTVCHRSITDLKRDHGIFSMSTSSHSNALLIFWDSTNTEMEAHVLDSGVAHNGVDYKPNAWHSICTTWDSTTGLVQMWFNGLPLIRQFTRSGTRILGPFIIVLGQEQDSHGGRFDSKQSFVGMMSDVHMWDYILSPCEIKNYVDMINFTPGNVLNWRAMEYQIFDKVLLEKQQKSCR